MFILGLSKEGAFTQHSQALLPNPEVQEMLWVLVWVFFFGGDACLVFLKWTSQIGLCHIETSVACLVQYPGGSSKVITMQAHKPRRLCYYVPAHLSFLQLSRKTAVLQAATRNLKPVPDKSGWQLVLYGNEYVMLWELCQLLLKDKEA